MEFIKANKIDQNLYNLLAYSIPRTEIGREVFVQCGARRTEAFFESGYRKIEETYGDIWRDRLVEVYEKYLSPEDIAALSALEGDERMIQIAERLTEPKLIHSLEEKMADLLPQLIQFQSEHMETSMRDTCDK